MRTKTLAYLLLVASLFSGASLPVLLDLGKSINLYEFMLMISTFGLASSLIFVLARKKTSKLISTFSEPKMLAIALIAGLLALLPIEFGIAYAEQYISASLTTAIFRTSPLLMLLLLPTLLREKLSRYQIIALLLAFLGLYIGISGGSIIAVNIQYASIIAFMALMAFGYAISNVLVKRYVIDIEIQLAAGGIAFFVVSLAMFIANGTPMAQVGGNGIILAFYIGAIFNVYSFYMAFYALRRVKTTIYTNTYFLSPFITFVFSYLFLGEPIKPYYIAIAVSVAAGILIQQFDKVGGSYLPKSTSKKTTNLFLFDVTGAFAETGEVTINQRINSGAKVLAVKLPVRYRKRVNDIYSGDGVYTSEYPSISKEARFIRETIRVNPREFMLMKVGDIDECESFFFDVERKLGLNVTK